MPLFFPKQRKSYYQIAGGEANDNSAHNTNEEVMHCRANENVMPPYVHEATNLSFESMSKVNVSGSSNRWDHIVDVDQFFSLIYEYHQGSGLLCIALRHVFALFQFIFVVVLSTFLVQCIDYDMLFNNNGTSVTSKRHINDIVVGQCVSHLHPTVVIALIIAFIFWIIQLLRALYRLAQLRDVKNFYNKALFISEAELKRISWREVVMKICKRQPELHLIVNQEEITPLDVYQRILRYKNYMIAFVDHDILPTTMNIPFIGKITYLSNGLRFNLEWLLFWVPWKGFCLRDEYKSGDQLDDMICRMRKAITWLGMINLVLFPFIFLYQILFTFFSLADVVRRDPGVLGSRMYSNYASLRLRHYNELDHELNLRLNRSYEFACKYMNQFISPVLDVVAKAIAFTCGSFFGILFFFTMWDEDVLTIEHLLTVMTVCGAVGLICRSFIVNENMVLCQNYLMRQVIASIHYAPTDWLNESQSDKVCAEFGSLFKLKIQHFMEELISPIITPFILLFKIRQKASDIVKFYHYNTRSSPSMGDVCSFSMMDITADGDLFWRMNQVFTGLHQNEANCLLSKKRYAKVELSLMNFAAQNPGWKPPIESREMMRNIREMWCNDLQQFVGQQQDNSNETLTPLTTNLNLFTSLIKSIHPADDEANTPPPSPTATAIGLSHNRNLYQQSLLMQSHTGGFAESAAAALSASMISKSLHSNNLSNLPINYFNGQVVPIISDTQIHELEMSMNALAVAELLTSHSKLVENVKNTGQYGTIASNNYNEALSPAKLSDSPNVAGSVWDVLNEHQVMETFGNSRTNLLELDNDEQQSSYFSQPPRSFDV